MEAADLLASLLESHCPGLRQPCQDFHPNIAAAIDRLKVLEIVLGDEKVAASQGTNLTSLISSNSIMHDIPVVPNFAIDGV